MTSGIDEQGADGLTVAHDLVPGVLDEVGIPRDSDAGQLALKYARQYGFETSIGRAPSSVAAGSVYFAGLMCNRKIVQPRVALAAGVTVSTVRKAYRDIAEAEGIVIESSLTTEDNSEDDSPGGWRERLKGAWLAYLRGER